MTKTKSDKIQKRYNRVAKIYDFMERPMERALAKWRDRLMKHVEGKVLEVGVGTGKNLKYYPEDIELSAIDFSPNMIEKAMEKAEEMKKPVKLFVMDAEDMDFPDNSFDTVVSSCVFCSVPDPVQGLKEIRRVCKDGGKVVMLEHVRSDIPYLGSLMDMMNPIPVHVYGANINRNTLDNLQKAGFENIEFKDLWLDIVKLIIIDNQK